MLHSRRFEDLTSEDIAGLIEGGVSESRTLDYKETLPGGKDADVKDFVADVTSFANAGGGDLLYGIGEARDADGHATGKPTLVGLGTANADQEIRRLEQMLRAGSDPSVPGVRFRFFEVAGGRSVLLLRIPRSWAAPHAVIARDTFRFYSRSTAGKYPMDVADIKSVVLQSATLTERVQRFRTERLSRVLAQETPVQMLGGALTALHLIPYSSLDPGQVLLPPWLVHQETRLVEPLCATGWDRRFNVDGHLTYAHQSGTGLVFSYLQVFRQGMLEYLDVGLLGNGPDPQIPGLEFEHRVIAATARGLALLRAFNIPPPVIVLLSLVGVRGYRMSSSQPRVPWLGEERRIDRDVVSAPDVLFESDEADPGKTLHPVFDVVWNATGWPGSPSYDGGGNRIA